MTRFDRLASASDHTKRVELTANTHATRPERVASAPDHTTCVELPANTHDDTARRERVASAPDHPPSANAMARPPRARRRKNGGVRGPFRGPRS